MKIYYHAFTDGKDGCFKTLTKAVKCVRNWNRQGLYNVRIYREIERSKNEVNPQEDCILNYGAFPF